MTFIAYWMGARAAQVLSGQWDLSAFLLGYAILFCIEWCTVLANEYYDYSADKLNKNFSIFTGGSRVLVNGMLTHRHIGIAIPVGLMFVVVFFCLFLWEAPAARALSLFLLLILGGLFLGLGYTTPPVKFSYRGLGEIVVGFTHSFYVVICGFAFQTGTIMNDLPWLLSIPLFFSIIAANLLAGVPDREADALVSKKSFAVVLGSRNVIVLAIGFVILAAMSGTLLWVFDIIGRTGIVILITVPHAVFLLYALLKLLQSRDYDRNINDVMALSLSYVVWFGIIPLLTMHP